MKKTNATKIQELEDKIRKLEDRIFWLEATRSVQMPIYTPPVPSNPWDSPWRVTWSQGVRCG